MSKKTFKPCCKKFNRVSVQYVDLVTPEDENLRMIAELLLRTNDEFPLNCRELHAIATEIERYINKKIVRENHLFNRRIDSCTFDDSDLKAEIIRLLGKLGNKN